MIKSSNPLAAHYLIAALLAVGLTNFSVSSAAPEHQLFPAKQSDQWGLIDQEGKWIVSPQFDQLDSFSEGRGIAFDGDYFGIIDADGEWIAAPEFRAAGRHGDHRSSPLTAYHDGYATYCWNPRPGTDRGCHLVDRDGQAQLTDQDFTALGRASEGLLGYQIDGPFGPWGLLDTEGEVAIEARFHEVGMFVEGVAPAAEERNSWGFINTEGEWVIEPQFRDATPFSDGLAAVEVDTWHWAYINRDGEMVLDQGYRDASPFDSGIAQVTDGDTREDHFIDREGQAVLSDLLERDDLCTILPFHNGLAPAVIQSPEASGCGAVRTGSMQIMSAENGVMAYFDTEGNVVWQAEG